MFTGDLLPARESSGSPDCGGRPAAWTDAPREETIGRSEENRPITVILTGTEGAPLRVLVMAGQHGDERAAVRAVRRLASAGGPLSAGASPAAGSPMEIALVPEVNPDGRARKTRRNGREIDLNRDHQRLRAAETSALHGFVRRWRPHLIVDVHNYPPRRKLLSRQKLVHCHDLFVDIPTNPNLTDGPLGLLTRELFRRVVPAINRRGYRCERYTLINASGRVRHSTPDISDARNGLALRYGIPTVLLEGRQPTRHDLSAERRRLQRALQAAILLVLRWAADNRQRLTNVGSGTAATALRSRYIAGSRPRTLAFRRISSGIVQPVPLPGKYTPRLEVTLKAPLPPAYAVPRALPNLCELLVRHGFVPHGAGPDERIWTQRYHLDTVIPSRTPHRMPRRLILHRTAQHSALHQYLIFPVAPESGHTLAVYLEPQSKYGLYRYPETGLTLNSGSVYPVLRVVTGNPLRRCAATPDAVGQGRTPDRP